MCDFVGTCLDVSKLTPEEIECLEKWLEERQAHLQAQVINLQEQLNDNETRITNATRS